MFAKYLLVGGAGKTVATILTFRWLYSESIIFQETNYAFLTAVESQNCWNTLAVLILFSCCWLSALVPALHLGAAAAPARRHRHLILVKSRTTTSLVQLW